MSSSTPGKMSKRGSAVDASDDDPPLKKAREDDKRTSFSSPGLSKLVGLNGLNRKERLHEKPDELFRKDLISAMKLADAEHLEPDMYVTIQDPWRQEWERGVQVPVHQTLKIVNLREKPENIKLQGEYAFKLPQKKMLYACKDENFQTAIHELHETHKMAEQVCRYDLDNVDVAWLNNLNDYRTSTGEDSVEEWMMEKVMEELETQCYNNMQTMIKTVEGLGIEYDENVVCDVCRSPESEDGNEMVFCDACDICVHQACYGVNSIPEGSWLCRSCAIGVTPKCVLCPKLGGAMKSTKSGSKWAHVACALWIPEVSIGDPEKMEPVTKVSHIPASRWSLVCHICRVKEGACIQCSVKTCKTAFHVTCGFSNSLDMKTVLDEEQDDVQLKAFCTKHSKKGGEITPRGSESSTSRKEAEMTEEEKTELRSHRLQKLAEEFYTCVKSIEVAEALKQDEETVDFIKNYWVLKRKANFNKPLLTPKTEEADLLSKQREDSLIARMKMFIHLRQDLERVRNLCYMVSRREKTRRQLYHLKEHIFHKQVEVVESSKEGTPIFQAITEAHKLHREDSVYDQYDAILIAAQQCLIRAQQSDDALAGGGVMEDHRIVTAGAAAAGVLAMGSSGNQPRRPSLDSTDDDGDAEEQTPEDLKQHNNRKLAGFKRSKLIRDRKEQDRRQKLKQEEEERKKAEEEKAAEKTVTEDSKLSELSESPKPSTSAAADKEDQISVAARGRKPKVDALEPPETPSNSKLPDVKPSPDKPEKGKVGRPRKRPRKSPENHPSSATSPVVSASTPAHSLASPEPAKLTSPRPRGRPPKKHKEEEMKKVDTNTNSSNSSSKDIDCKATEKEDVKGSTAKTELKSSTAKTESKSSTAKTESRSSSAKTESKSSGAKAETLSSTAKTETQSSNAKMESKSNTANMDTQSSTAKTDTQSSTDKTESKSSTAKKDMKASTTKKSDEKSSSVKTDAKSSSVKTDTKANSAKTDVRTSSVKTDIKSSNTNKTDARSISTNRTESKASAAHKTDTKSSNTNKTDARSSSTNRSESKASAAHKTDTKASAAHKTDTKASAAHKTDTKASAAHKTDTKASAAHKTDTKASASHKTDTKASSAHKSDTKAGSGNKTEAKSHIEKSDLKTGSTDGAKETESKSKKMVKEECEVVKEDSRNKREESTGRKRREEDKESVSRKKREEDKAKEESVDKKSKRRDDRDSSRTSRRSCAKDIPSVKDKEHHRGTDKDSDVVAKDDIEKSPKKKSEVVSKDDLEKSPKKKSEKLDVSSTSTTRGRRERSVDSVVSSKGGDMEENRGRRRRSEREESSNRSVNRNRRDKEENKEPVEESSLSRKGSRRRGEDVVVKGGSSEEKVAGETGRKGRGRSEDKAEQEGDEDAAMRSLRSSTPAGTSSSSTRQRSLTPMSRQGEDSSAEEQPQQQPQHQQGSAIIDVDSIEPKPSKRPRLSLRRASRASLPEQSNETGAMRLQNKRISLGDPMVELSRLKQSDFKKKEQEVEQVSNLRVKDQNRPSPKSFKDKAKIEADPIKDGDQRIQINGIHSFLKRQLVVPASIRRKVQSKFQCLKQSRMLRGSRQCDHAQRKIDNFFSCRNGAVNNSCEIKENAPVVHGRLSPAVSPRTSSAGAATGGAGSSSQPAHPQPGATPAATPPPLLLSPHHLSMDDAAEDSDTDSVASRCRRRSLRSLRPPDPNDEDDEGSRHSTASSASRYSTRSARPLPVDALSKVLKQALPS